jgi:hypothetical protein
VSDGDLEALVLDVLGDDYRSGTPPKFTPEQVAQIISLARATEGDWLARDALDATGAQSSGEETADRRRHLPSAHRACFFGGPRFVRTARSTGSTRKSRIKPSTRSKFAPCATSTRRRRNSRLRCEGGELRREDEHPGPRAGRGDEADRGLDEKREFEYIRRGTSCLIASFDVVTGKIVTPSLGPTRDEKDFALHILGVVASDPMAKWVFVVDNLTTHVSESLVRIAAKASGLDVDLGVKGQSGILKNVASRRAFLIEKDHQIRFVYTPKHCSWLNQIECWFSILTRRVLKRGSFTSVDELNKALLDFIDYFNLLFAKPFKWTFTGRALTT